MDKGKAKINQGKLRRRDILLGAASVSLTSSLAANFSKASNSLNNWDVKTDVLVMGSGSAGTSAAIEARRSGADVLVIEGLSQLGGSSAMSGGVVYAGGGTALQRALKITDTVDSMYDFITKAGGVHPEPRKVQRYCEGSVEHFDWLVANGVPYSENLSLAKGIPMGEASLYFSGCELAWPANELALPAPRGHVPGRPGMTGGRYLMAALQNSSNKLGVRYLTRTKGMELLSGVDGMIRGVIVEREGKMISILARKAVILASGGFIHNREMLEFHAPELAACSVPWGSAGDQGDGINMGVSAGATTLRMNQGFAIAPIYPPEDVISGIVVNENGQRFLPEDTYHGVLGDAIAYHQGGKAWLITDEVSGYKYKQDNFLAVAKADTISTLSQALGFPDGSLENTVSHYNRFAKVGSDPVFKKDTTYLRPLESPFTAWDLSVTNAFFPAHTFGGLKTTVDSEVTNSSGEIIPKLYAVGRTSAGIPIAPYFASGLSVGDCTFFGRIAGSKAASLESISA